MAKPSPKKKKNKAVAKRSPKLPRIREIKRKEIFAVSWRMKKENPDCTHRDVRKALINTNPIYWTKDDRKRVERWTFVENFEQKNRGASEITPELRQAVLDRNADPTVLDVEKTSRRMAEHFTGIKKPISNDSVHKIYVEDDLYPARETPELDLRQHHHRRLRVHFVKQHRRKTEEDWEAYVNADETIIRMEKPHNVRNSIRWVKKGTVRFNPRPSPKHVSSVFA